MTRPTHAAVQMTSLGGQRRTYGTLCDLSGGHGSSIVTTDPAQVTCQKCRQSTAFKGWSKQDG